MASASQHFVLAVGTQVVVRVEARVAQGTVVHPRGAVGVVIASPADPQHSYRVRFLDGFEASFRRPELAILKEFKDERPVVADPIVEHDLARHVIYRCVVGSRAYGLDDAESDYDRRGVYLPPAELHWSLQGVPEQLDYPATEECYWEIQKFLVMACKANPNILECLYSPLVEHATELAREMLAMRECFLSQRVYQTYSGYVASQFKKLEGDLRNRGEVKWKHVMHLIRLLESGITVLREGYVPVRVEGQREMLLAIKRGAIPWAEVDGYRRTLHEKFDEAYAQTRLPDYPDYERVNAFLLKARRLAAD